METLRGRNEHSRLIIAGKVAGGAFAGAALFAFGADKVSAHDSTDSDTTTIDLDKGETVWGEAIEAGISESRIPELLSWYSANIPNIPDFTNMPTGYTLPIPQHLLTGIAGDSIDLDKGETVWGEAIEAGIPESEIPALVTWLEDNVADMPSFDAMPVGYVLPLPTHLSTTAPPSPVPAGPTEITVQQGSTIINELVDLGVENPLAVVDEVLVANDMTLEEAAIIPAGTEIVIPAGVIPVVTAPQSVDIAPSAVLVPESVPIELLPPAEPVAVEPAPVLVVEELTQPAEGVATPADVPQETTTQPSTEAQTVQPEIQIAPERQAYSIIMNSLLANGGVLAPEDSAQAYTFITMLPRHPGGDPEFPYPYEFVMMPAPSADMPFVVHPNTCSEELYILPSSVLSSMVTIAVNEWVLMLPENESKRTNIVQKGDGGSGDHRRHGSGRAVDDRTITIGAEPMIYPDGFAYNMSSPNYDPQFTVHQLVLQLLAKDPSGNFLIEKIEYSDNLVIDEVNLILFNMGRLDEPMHYVEGHTEHIHKKTRLIGFEDPNAEAGPNTTAGCDQKYLVLDPAMIQEIMARRALYPVSAPPAQLIPEPIVEEPTQEVVVEPSGYWSLAPNYKETIAASSLSESRKEYLLLLTEKIMQRYETGAVLPPRATLAMAMWEGGWGEGKGVIEGNNPFSHKVSREWAEEHPDEVVWIIDDEYNDEGEEIASPFRKYASLDDALDAHIALITESRLGQYEDAEKCRMNDKTFLQGLIHELRRDCSIGKMKGEDGVMSYATGENYVEKLNDLAANSVISDIILLNPDEQQRMLTQEWLDYYAA